MMMILLMSAMGVGCVNNHQTTQKLGMGILNSTISSINNNQQRENGGDDGKSGGE
jgi:hypothetical protein